MNKSYSSGNHHLEIRVDNNEDVIFTFEKNSKGNLFITLTGNGDLNINYNLLSSSSWNILSLNQSDESLVVKEVINLSVKSYLNMNYGELTHGNHIKDTVINFNEEASILDFNAAILSFSSLKWDILAHHLAKHTEANVNNQAIVVKEGHLDLDIIGKIDNGFSGSKTHQMSRIMNLGSNLNTTVHPQLLIEENDVEASHAASVGQADEEHIYYLQSRGLTEEEALKLIIKGYLLPIANKITDEETKAVLEDEIERKVMEAWEM